MIKYVISLILIVMFFLYFLFKKLQSHLTNLSKIITNKLTDIELNRLFKDDVQVIVVKNYLNKQEIEKYLNQINNYIDNNPTKYTKWKYSKDKEHDVNIFQYPLSYVLNKDITPTEYFYYNEKINRNLYNNSPKKELPFYNINKELKKFFIKVGQDDRLINNFPQYSKYNNSFLDSLVRIYEPNSYPLSVGLIHKDVDETGFYKNCDIYSSCIYLRTPDKEDGKEGGNLRLWKNFLFNTLEIKPEEGDLIIFNTSYLHSVTTFNKGKRVSFQSFLINDKDNDNIYLRI